VPARRAKGDDDVLRQMRDRAEIEDLMWRYARALDTGNAEAYVAVYTPDGQAGTGANATKGRDALRRMVAGLNPNQAAGEAKGQPRRPPMYHMTTNHSLTFIDKDQARLDADTSRRSGPPARAHRCGWQPSAVASTNWCASTASG